MFRKTLAALIVATAALVTSAYADYAAIAYSPSTGSTGWSYNYSYLGDAQAVALSNCNASDAKIMVWSQNGWCALAVGDNGGYGYGWGSSQYDAECRALLNCAKNDTGGHIVARVFSGTDY